MEMTVPHAEREGTRKTSVRKNNKSDLRKEPQNPTLHFQGYTNQRVIKE